MNLNYTVQLVNSVSNYIEVPWLMRSNEGPLNTRPKFYPFYVPNVLAIL
jgi:hypothetical protein